MAMRLLIPSNRLKWLPRETRLAHEYCFFLHDEMVRLLMEYEQAEAHLVEFKFSSVKERRRFQALSKSADPLTVLRALGRESEARRVVMNTITMAMLSDCTLHIYEALRCLEKGKIVPGLNLLRKPLLDHLVYFTWMTADEEAFHREFTSGDPNRISQKVAGNHRRGLLKAAVHQVGLSNLVDAEDLHATLFEASNPDGLYGFLQHAVHLVTVSHVHIRTTPENFNFIFNEPANPDTYLALYEDLPMVLLYLTLVVVELYGRMRPMDSGAKTSLEFRATNGYRLLYEGESSRAVVDVLRENLEPSFKCTDCKTALKVTKTNAARLVLSDAFQCTSCRKKQLFPLSWMV